MPLPRDPDILRVPAFMRKRSLSSRLRKPLVLTAFDRKKAVSLRAATKGAAKQSPAKRSPKKKSQTTFSAPLLNFYAAPQKKRLLLSARNDNTVGAVTHYYEKIRVGVIKLTGTLSVGDCITYETAEGPYEQIVESMEIDRQPVFKAGRGKEIGLKLAKIPRAGSKVSLRGL